MPPPEPYPVRERTPANERPWPVDDTSQGWPRSAKVAVAILGVLALAGGAAAGWFAWRAADESDDTDAAVVTADLDAEIERHEAELAELRDERDAALADADAATADRDALASEVDELGSQIDALDARLAELEERVAGLEGPTESAPPSETSGAPDTTPDETPAEQDDNSGEPDEVPTPAGDISPDALLGDYTIEFTEEYCEGPVSCGSPPGPAAASIVESNEGWLELVVPDMLTVALFDIDGGLSGIGDSTTIVEPCDGTDRAARVLVTVWLDDATATADGGDIEGLRASFTISALPSEGCPYALAFFASSLIPS